MNNQLTEYIEGQWVPVEPNDFDFGKWSPACELTYKIGSNPPVRTIAQIVASHAELEKLIDERIDELREVQVPN